MRLVLIAIACCLGAAVNASAAEIKSISRLAAGPENVLFVADWKTARVHAINLPASAQKPAGTAFNILDLEDLLSRQVGGAKITVEDMVVRPGTAEVYVAVSYGAAKTPALFVVTSDRRARRVDLKAAKSTSISASRRAHVELQVLEGNARAKLYSDRHEMARWGALRRRPFEPGVCFDPATDQVPVRFAAVDHVSGDLSHRSQPDRDACPDSGDEFRDSGRQALSRRRLYVHAHRDHTARRSEGWRPHSWQDDCRARLRQHARRHDRLHEDRAGQDGGVSDAGQLRTGVEHHPGVGAGGRKRPTRH